MGIIGSPIIGYFQESSANVAIAEQMPSIHDSVVEDKEFQLGGYSIAAYTAVSQSKINTLSNSQSIQATKLLEKATQSSLASIAIFPAVMLLSYIVLFFFFKSRGGYRPKVIGQTH